MNSKLKGIGNIIFICGVFTILMLNLNMYSWYQKLANINYAVAAALMTIVFACYADWKKLIKDKLFLLLVFCDLLSAVGIFIYKCSVLSFLTTYSLSVIIYLADKIEFSKIQRRVLMVVLAVFFVYWTIDVKGYFKGYSTNFGGLVLIGGFLFLVVIVEDIREIAITKKIKFISDYPYYLSLFEAVLFFIAYKIMAWYQSRTAVASLLVFGVLLVALRLMMSGKIKRILLTGISFVISIAFPVIYILLVNTDSILNNVIFSKPLLSSRNDNWRLLYNLLKTHPFIGNGTIVVSEGTSFRPGLLDTCNGFLQLAVPAGMIVALIIYSLLAVILVKQSSKITSKHQAVMYISVLVMIVCSSSESFIILQPFVLYFAAGLFILNSLVADKAAPEQCSLGLNGFKAEYKACFETEYKNKFIPVLCVTGVITIMYLILGPLEIFYSNYSEFEFNTSDFVWYFVLIAAVITVAVTLILSSVPKIYSKIYSAVVFAIAIGSYVQYMFVNGDLVDEEGNFVLDLNIGIRYYISIIVFLVCFIMITVLFIKLKDGFSKAVTYGSLALILILSTAIVSMGVSLLGKENKSSNIMALDATDEFMLAKDENTIVLVLDTFGRTVLKEELAEDAGCIDFLHDFTYFDKHDSVYCPTFPSLYHLLTEYEFSEDERDEYEKLALSSDSSKRFFDEIHENGYLSGIYSIDIHSVECATGCIDNIRPCYIEVNKNRVREMLYTLSMYRYMPYNLKKQYQMYNPKQNTVDYSIVAPGLTNDVFFERMNEWGMGIDETVSKKFTLSHLYGVHAPILNDENCMLVSEDSVSRHARTQGVFKAVDTYLSNLKELGIYDSSTIIVMADHGEYGNTDSVFFEKKPYEQHDNYVTDSTEITHHDFQNIILESLR